MRYRALVLAALLAPGCKTTEKKPGGDPPPTPVAKTPAIDAAVVPGSDGVPAMRKPVCDDAAACETACAQGKGEAAACLRLARLLRAGVGVDQDLARSRKVLEASCNAGHGRACVALGDMEQSGVGAAADRGAAMKLFARACDGGEGAGCRNAGIMHLAGIGVPRDPDQAKTLFARARGLYETACKGGDALACSDLGLLTEKGFGGGADPAAGAALYGKACDAGEPDGCQKLANTLVNTDPARAMRLLESACVAEFGLACNTLGAYYMRGTDTIGVDLDRAFHYFGMACDAGYAPGCGSRAELIMAGKITGQNPAAAIKEFERSCALADSTGCFRLGQMMKAAPSPENDKKAAEYFARACDVGMAPACTELAALTTDKAEAKRLRETACRLGDQTACE